VAKGKKKKKKRKKEKEFSWLKKVISKIFFLSLSPLFHHRRTTFKKSEQFLAFYSAFWMAQNFVRPLRFSAALALAPAFDKFIDFLSTKLKITRPQAFGVYLFILGTATSALVFGGIFLACGPAAYAR